MRLTIFFIGMWCLLCVPLHASGSKSDYATEQSLRIVALAPHVVESLFTLGAGDQIIATMAHSDYPEQAKRIPRVGNYARLQIEKIVQLKPDVVIAWRTGNPEDDLTRLRKYGIKVVYSNPTSLESIADDLLFLGEIVGKEEQARALARDYKKRLSELKKKYAKAIPVKGFYELWARPLRTVANDAWLQKQLEVCGVLNPFASLNEDYPLVSLEKVLASNPQIVIQPTPHSVENSDALNWQKWPQISAVKHGFIFHPDADKTHRMTTRMLDEVELLCENVHKARVTFN